MSSFCRVRPGTMTWHSWVEQCAQRSEWLSVAWHSWAKDCIGGWRLHQVGSQSSEQWFWLDLLQSHTWVWSWYGFVDNTDEYVIHQMNIGSCSNDGQAAWVINPGHPGWRFFSCPLTSMVRCRAASLSYWGNEWRALLVAALGEVYHGLWAHSYHQNRWR